MKINHKSGFYIETDVFFYDEIKKYNAGFFIVNPDGMKTNRIAPDPTMYSTEQEAEEISKIQGKKTLLSFLSGKETLYFDQQ